MSRKYSQWGASPRRVGRSFIKDIILNDAMKSEGLDKPSHKIAL